MNINESVWFGKNDEMRFETDNEGYMKCVVNDGDIYFTSYLSPEQIEDLKNFFNT